MEKMLSGKTAVVTGANRGIGYTIVEKLAEQGADVFACARKENEEFQKKMQEIGKRCSVQVLCVYFDLLNRDEILLAAKQIIKQSNNKIDILVNNAGITARSTLHMTSIKELEDIYRINFFHSVYLTQLISKCMMKKNSGGTIINIASISGIDNAEGTLAYGGSKASIVWSTKTLALELGKYNIRVNSVAPGLIDTEMIGYKTSEEKEELVASTCLKRIGTTCDVANTVLFLASDLSSYITGQTIRVDGGKV